MSHLDEFEQMTKSETNSREAHVLSVIEDLINLHLAGFGQIGSFTLTADNRPQQVWLRLSSRAFNSLRCAYHLLQAGYYSQAMMLTRGAFEDWLVCEDSKEHEETIAALLDRKGRVPSFSKMANRLEKRLQETWRGIAGDDGLYGLLSTFAHPRYRAAAVMVDPATQNLRLGPSWDEDLFIVTSNYLVIALMRMMDFILPLVSQESERRQELGPLMDRGLRCCQGLNARAMRRTESQ